jgi:hypothetical protein
MKDVFIFQEKIAQQQPLYNQRLAIAIQQGYRNRYLTKKKQYTVSVTKIRAGPNYPAGTFKTVMAALA